MAVRVTTLIENGGGEHLALKSEHGLSFHVETDRGSFLFDSGQSGRFIDNAKQLNIDLAGLDYVVLSHGHYDHSGGIRALCEVTRDYELIMGKGFFDKKYGYNSLSYEYLGSNFDEKYLQDMGMRYRFVDRALTQLLPGVHVVTGFPRIHPDEVINSRFKLERDGAMIDDPFDDEVLIAIDTPEGLLVLLGCSHPGMKNMLEATTALTGRPLYAILGGTHLVEADQNCMSRSLTYLNDRDLKILGVSHCTGQSAMDHLAVSNRRYFHNRTGSSLIID